MDKKTVQKDELIDNLKTQFMIASMQELLSSMTEKCFNKCIFKPSSSLDSGEIKCLNYCVERYMDSRNLITHGFIKAAQNQKSANFDF